MTFIPFIAWALVAVLAALAGMFALSQVRTVLRRRARRAHYRQGLATTETALAQLPQRPPMTRDQVAAISSDAQQAAWRVARNMELRPANPHPARTREFVLWEATFHSALSDFVELVDAPHEVDAVSKTPL